MAGAYMAKWNAAGEQPSTGWRMALDGLTRAQIGHGIRRALAEFPEWPPTAGQFRRLCVDYVDPTTLDDNALVAACQRAEIQTIGRSREALIVALRQHGSGRELRIVE